MNKLSDEDKKVKELLDALYNYWHMKIQKHMIETSSDYMESSKWLIREIENDGSSSSNP